MLAIAFVLEIPTAISRLFFPFSEVHAPASLSRTPCIRGGGTLCIPRIPCSVPPPRVRRVFGEVAHFVFRVIGEVAPHFVFEALALFVFEYMYSVQQF